MNDDATTAPAVTGRDLGKRYVKYVDTPLLLNALRPWVRTERSKLWALRNLSFTADVGECVGVIGQNGSGKSTLLRMLAGVTAPTEGSISVRGRVAPLIAVGVGFHPELTGRENVYVNGNILGLSRAQIDERFDDIAAFADIGSFIDTPVKFYSSGMTVRLGFSVAVIADPDVLLVDEVLAVGDVRFQLKCFRRMAEIKARGTTIFVVSHNLNAIRQLCDRAIVLHNGESRHDGDVTEAISLYHDLLGEELEPETSDFTASAAVPVGAVAKRFQLLGPDGMPTGHVSSDDEITLELVAEVVRPLRAAFVGLNVTNTGGVNVYSDSSPWTGTALEAGDEVVLRARIRPNLGTGTLMATISLFDGDEGAVMEPVKPVMFYVSGRPTVVGVADLHAAISLDQAKPTGRTPPMEHDGLTA